MLEYIEKLHKNLESVDGIIKYGDDKVKKKFLFGFYKKFSNHF